MRAVREDVEEGAASGAGERGITGQGPGASLLLARALDEALGVVAGRVFHGQRLAEDGLVSGVREARGERDSAGQRRELRKLSHVVPSVVCRAAGACTARTIRRGERLAFRSVTCQGNCTTRAAIGTGHVFDAPRGRRSRSGGGSSGSFQ